MPSPPRRNPWVWVAAVLVFGFLCVGLLGILLLAAGLRMARSGLDSVLEIRAEGDRLRERVVYAPEGAKDDDDRFAVVTVSGAIDGGGSFVDGEGAVDALTRRLRRIGEDQRVKGVLLRVDSPGGTLTASDLMHREIMRLREERKIPVVGWVDSHAMSGGYYLLAACDAVVVAPTATVGSIGVVITHMQFEELLGKIGVRVEPVTSGEHKDFASSLRALTEEDRERLSTMVKKAHQRFVDVVSTGRSLPREDVEALADGSWFDAREAWEAKLVDEIGYFDAALSRLEKASGVRGAVMVSYGESSMGLASLFSMGGEAVGRGVVRELKGGGEGRLRVEAVGGGSGGGGWR